MKEIIKALADKILTVNTIIGAFILMEIWVWIEVIHLMVKGNFFIDILIDKLFDQQTGQERSDNNEQGNHQAEHDRVQPPESMRQVSTDTAGEDSQTL